MYQRAQTAGKMQQRQSELDASPLKIETKRGIALHGSSSVESLRRNQPLGRLEPMIDSLATSKDKLSEDLCVLPVSRDACTRDSSEIAMP